MGTARTRVVEEGAMQAIEELNKGLGHLVKAQECPPIVNAPPMDYYPGLRLHNAIDDVRYVLYALKRSGQEKEEPCNKP